VEDNGLIWYENGKRVRFNKLLSKKFFDGELAVMCKTEERAKRFLEKLDDIGVVFTDECTKEKTRWDWYGDEICYFYTSSGVMCRHIGYQLSVNRKLIRYIHFLEVCDEN